MQASAMGEEGVLLHQDQLQGTAMMTSGEGPGFARGDSSTNTFAIMMGCFLLTTFFLVVVGLIFYSVQDSDVAEGGGRGRDFGGSPMAVPDKPTDVPGGDGKRDNTIPTLPPVPSPVPATTQPSVIPPSPVITTEITTPQTFPPTVVIPTTTEAATTTTTTPPPPLLCSVNFIAVLNASFPPDNTCDILIYTHVRIEERKIVAVDNDVSYVVFKGACKLYARTTCGISFDIRYISRDMFSNTEVRDELAAAKTSRINHYAIMNIYENKELVANYTVQATSVFAEFRRLLGDDRETNKVIFGIGYFIYNESNAWRDLLYAAENTASNDVDVVVIITTVLAIRSRSECTTLPANALRSPNDFPPTMEKALPAAMASFSSRRIIVAFSFQMGVLVYNLKGNHTTPLDALYKECTAMSVSDYSQACQVNTADLFNEKIVIGLSRQQEVQALGRQYLQAHDTLEFMIDKARIIMSTQGRRPLFTWFLFNVHLTDVSGRCLSGGPFARVKGFRDFYYQEAQKG